MEVYLGIIYIPIPFGDAAPSVLSSIGRKAIFLWMVCVCSLCHISQGTLFRFRMKVYLGIIYKPMDFGDAASIIPSYIGSKVIFFL